MLLYHYSKEKRPMLLTLERQNKVSASERVKEEKEYVKACKLYGYIRPGYYFEHISFFFERPPLENMSSFYGPGHQVWYKGNELYEHVVDSSKIGSFLYEIVESPEKTEIYYNNSLSDKEYFERLGSLMNKNLYVGKNNALLEEALKPLLGTTEEYFKLLKTRSNFEEIRNKYAATVPHLMVYPIVGQIKPSTITKVTIG